jgi:predicted MFS family arabinose efflux permease
MLSASVYDTPTYKRSRSAYRLFCMLDYFIALLVSDVYLFKLLTCVGLSDSQIGIVSSLITVACLFQLTSIGFVRRIRRVRRWVVASCIASQMVFILLYALSFVPMSTTAKTALAFAGILLGYFFNYAVTSILFQWANAYVDPRRRATYSAEKEMMSLLGGMIFTFARGVAMDRFELADRLGDAFLLIIGLGMLICAASLVTLLRIDGGLACRPDAEGAQPQSFRAVFAGLRHNRGFMRIVVLSVLWSCSQYMTIGFLGSYKSRELMLSVSVVQLINIAGNLCRLAVSRPFGRYADRPSYVRGIELALYVSAVGFLALCFSTPADRWLIVVFSVLNAVSQAGVSQNLLNVVYDYVPPEYFVQASSIKNSIGGICGFGASLIGSAILSGVQQRHNVILGIPVYGQQVLALISFVLTVLTALYIRFAMRAGKPAAA